MIYSNFPRTLYPESAHIVHNYLHRRIMLGDDIGNGNYLPIYCPEGTAIESGLNDMLDFAFGRNASLIVKQYREDRHNFDDPRWTVSDELFLLLTSNVNEVDGKNKKVRRNGLITTLEKDSISAFSLYARLTQQLNRKYITMTGVYKLQTSKPCVIRISPPDSDTNQFLVIHDNQVIEFPCMNKVLDAFIRSLGISNNIVREHWSTI